MEGHGVWNRAGRRSGGYSPRYDMAAVRAGAVCPACGKQNNPDCELCREAEAFRRVLVEHDRRTRHAAGG
jgi:hypothetical protein